MVKLTKRKRGQKLPEGTAYIGRGTKWGNPYRVNKDRTAKEAVQLYKEYLEEPIATDYRGIYPIGSIRAGIKITNETKRWHILKSEMSIWLTGKNLSCWCGEWEPGEPEIDCHGVILMKYANGLES